ncbi:MAG: HD domain-containing protein [Myxococcaceae bacterium]|nr:HD domain-containing protein [Myxococcaceae bacterium]
MARILVVDDDKLLVQALTKIIEADGHEAITHLDPLNAAEERDFSVVVTDFMMPGLSGTELLSILKQTNPHAIRVMLTAANDFSVAMEAVNRGEVFRLLAKPWTLADVTQCIRQAVSHHDLLAENRRLQSELGETNALLTQLNHNLEGLVVERTNGLLDGMVRALDYRDTETQWHSRRVALFARRLAEAVGVKGAMLDIIEQGALLHDIGKIGVRDSILLKPGPLTPEEWVEMRLHPDIGFRMLANIPYLSEASKIVHQHQERWDGKGYPLGLKGTDIVIGARVFSIVDALDAITSDRPYRRGQTVEIARSEIARCVGTQFDPELVAAFLAQPDSVWHGVRAHVERLEEEDKKKWEGRPLMVPFKAPPKAAAP